MNQETQTLAEIGRCLVLIAMTAAAAAKSRDVRGFAGELSGAFAWLGGASARAAAAAVVIAEWTIVALLLVGGDAARLGLLAALALLTGFTAVVAWSVAFDRGLVCSCFGAAASHRMNGYDLARNLLLMGAAALACWQAPARDIAQTLATQPAAFSIALAGCAAAVFLLITSLQDIALLLRIESGR